MSTVLTDAQRKTLEAVVLKARDRAELAAHDALAALAVAETHRPSYLDDPQNELRLALRAKARQLGDDVVTRGADLTLLTRDVAYEQWHRLLFARFLERNGLLRHSEFPDTPVTLDDCEALASAGEVDEPDGWSVAANFAARLLPGVFRLDDPAFQVRYAAEHRLALEDLLMSIPESVFGAEDALGWVYQFWQTSEKKRVKKTGIRIGGADLSPVTQLFTENYMVRFLLENSLGAWWSARHPDSQLVTEWDYLRRVDDGTPAAGTFAAWPATAAEITAIDPCCGSGHFLVAMFGMLWRMRAEEEGLTAADAQDAVLRDNLFGLELDPRCAQIATFNVSLEAWKQGGYRAIPTPQIACSGVPVRQTLHEWLDGVPEHLHAAMTHLHSQFRDADTLGSLVDPLLTHLEDGTLLNRELAIDFNWDEIHPHLAEKFTQEDATGTVLGHATEDVVQAATLLAHNYTLTATNPPFLGLRNMSPTLSEHVTSAYPDAANDLATCFQMRAARLAAEGGTVATVTPSSWTFMPTLHPMRTWVTTSNSMHLLAHLGAHAFSNISGERVNVVLTLTSHGTTGSYQVVNASQATTTQSKALSLRQSPLWLTVPSLDRKGRTTTPTSAPIPGLPLSDFAMPRTGLQTGDDPRYRRRPWELPQIGNRWRLEVSSEISEGSFSGYNSMVYWPHDDFYRRRDSAHLHSVDAEGRPSIVVKLTGEPRATLYDGDVWHQNCARLVPHDTADLPALWAFVTSPEFRSGLKAVDSAVNARPSSLGRVSFDAERWRSAALANPALPPASSADPREWIFDGSIATSKHPLQVAMAQLLGFQWPQQDAFELEDLSDSDGIVPLPDLGDGSAASRLRNLLATAHGSAWSSSLEAKLVTDAGASSGNLEEWLRSSFFNEHVKTFLRRPFMWHVWDGHKDGFSAVINYHRLDTSTLEKLTYTVLGAWIQRQKQAAENDSRGAGERLKAAKELQEKLAAILTGEPPFDIYVRWKELHEQPLGWDPDLDDGVRLNIRPFVKAGILRGKVNVKWEVPRYKEEDLHFTTEEKRAARRTHGVSDA